MSSSHGIAIARILRYPMVRRLSKPSGNGRRDEGSAGYLPGS